MQKMQVQSLGQEDPLEEEVTTHSSVLAWRIPWMEESGRLQSTGSQSRTRLKELSTKCLGALQGVLNVWEGVLWVGRVNGYF